MEHLIYVSIILGGIVLFWTIWNAEHRTLRRVRRERNEIVVEEHRMFDFLHGLGVSLIEDSSPPNMHRYIVEGVSKVVDGDAGILYLIDNERDRIVPVCQSAKTCPVLPLPEELEGHEAEKGAAKKYRTFIRLSSLDLRQGLMGKALEKRNVLRIDDLGEYFGYDASEFYHRGVSLIVVPLVYANKQIGVLAVSRPGNNPFNDNDRDVFASVTEQCSFALGSAIIHAEAAEKRRLERELLQASEIQRILLPKDDPELSDFRLAATYRPARHVSGDYYDYLKVDDDHYGVAIADVCGKGIAASLVMAMCRSTLRSASKANLSPAAVLQSVNSLVFPDIREDMFVSFFYLILSRGSKSITLASAGHEPPLIRRVATGEVEVNEVKGMAVGVDKGSVFNRVVEDHYIALETGDILLVYTDGLIEAGNREGEEFGFERLRDTFQQAEGTSAKEVLDYIMNEIEVFSKGTNPIDDITLIAIEKR